MLSLVVDTCTCIRNDTTRSSEVTSLTDKIQLHWSKA